MSIRFMYAPEKGKLLDFIAVLNLSTRVDKLDDIFKEMDVDVSISNAYSRVLENIRSNFTGVKLFFEPGSQGTSFFAETFNSMLLDVDSINEIIDHFKACDYIFLQVKLLSFYDDKNDFSDDFYKMLISNKELLTEFLNGLNLSAETKWDIINFVNFPGPFINKMLLLFENVTNEIDREYEHNADLFVSYYNTVKKDIDKKIAGTFDKDDPIFNGLLNKHNFAILQFSVIFFAPYTIQYVYNNRQLNIYLGYEFEKMFKFIEDVNIDVTTFFKSFTDNTRVQILQLINERQLSAGEIGREIGVSPSSLSHHLDVLSEANIISRVNKGKRSLFSLNKNVIMLAINELSKLANS